MTTENDAAKAGRQRDDDGVMCANCGHYLGIHSHDGCQIGGCPCGNSSTGKPHQTLNDQLAAQAATIRELREAVRAQREALETIAAMRCTDHANCRVFGASVESVATAAIARAREEGV